MYLEIDGNLNTLHFSHSKMIHISHLFFTILVTPLTGLEPHLQFNYKLLAVGRMMPMKQVLRDLEQEEVTQCQVW